jgi:hypothetical protein
VANIFGNWLNCVDPRFKLLNRVGALVIIWLLWLCRNHKVLATKKLLLCRLSIPAKLRSVCGHHCHVSTRLRLEDAVRNIFLNMKCSVSCRLAQLRLRPFFSFFICNRQELFNFLFFRYVWICTAVYILVINLLSNKSSIIKKTWCQVPTMEQKHDNTNANPKRSLG